MDSTQLRVLRQRYRAHVARREHSAILRPGQMRLAQDILSWLYERDEGERDFHSRGYFVRPTGTGKTVSLIDFIMGINSGEKTGEMKWDKRVLVLTPTNVLNEQFAAEMGVEKFRTPEKQYAFNIPEDKIGVYDATANPTKQQDSLNKHIVVMTYDAFMSLAAEGRVNVHDFAATLLDEVHTRPRGDNTRQFIREHVFNEAVDDNNQVTKLGDPATLTIGATATHLYKSGQTIGDYLFGGDQPIHLTRINDAVQDHEISGYRNVIVESGYNPDASFEGDRLLKDTVRKRILRQQARDDDAVRILQHGFDPITHVPYRNMKSVWYCRNIHHAHRLAAQINTAMHADETAPYAQPVHGTMNKREFHGVIANYKRGNEGAPKALTNADILIHGFDDERAELCFMTWPSGSPIEVLQMGGRVLRTHRLKPHATIFSFPDPYKDSPIFGELAGSYHSLPGDYEYPPTTSRGPRGEPLEPYWPEEIRDLRAYYRTRDIEMFASRRRQAQASDKKPDFMLTVAEMAKKIGMNKDILEKYVFMPLQGLYDQRHSRQQELDIRDAEQDNVFINGQRFAVGSSRHPGMGYFRTGANEATFCMNKEAANACRFALFGKLPEPKKYLYSKESARRLVDIPQAKIDEITLKIEEAYHRRNNYQRVLDIDGIHFRLNYDVQFCIDRNQPKLYFSSEGLQKLFQLAHGATADQSLEWWVDHKDKLFEVKSPLWQNKEEVMLELNIHPRHASYKSFDALWRRIERKHKEALKKDPHNIGADMDDGTWVGCAYKRTEVIPNTHNEFCLDHDAVEWIKQQPGIDVDTGEQPQRGSARGGR